MKEKKRYELHRWAVFCLSFCIIISGLSLAWSVFAAFDEPTGIPPEENIGSYVTIGDQDQAKQGSLRLGTDDNSGPYPYQLEVVGEGALITNTIVENDLKISEESDILYVDSTSNQVCVGPCYGEDQNRLEVSSGQVRIEAGSNEGLHAESTNTEAIYSVGGDYGILGTASGSENYGIWAVNPLGPAIGGLNTNDTDPYSPIGAFSSTGYALYATNLNTAGLWSGYFRGLVESSRDVVGAKFISKKPTPAWISSVQGTVAETFPVGSFTLQHFDGTHAWGTDGTNLVKVRASDGFKLLAHPLAGVPVDILTDGEDAWSVLDNNTVVHLDEKSGDVLCTIDLSPIPETNVNSMAFTGHGLVDYQGKKDRYYWVTGLNADLEGILGKVNYHWDSAWSCQLLDADTVTLTPDGYSVGKVIYDGTYLQALANDPPEGFVLSVNPSSGESVRWDSLVGNGASDIFFDNAFYWVTNRTDNTITRYQTADSRVCAEKNPSTADWQSCSVDRDCDDVGGSNLGGCFPVPIPFGTYSVGTDPEFIAFDGNNIWVANTGSNDLTRLDADDPSVSDTYPLGFTPTGLAYDGESYLLISHSGGLSRVYTGQGIGRQTLAGALTLQNDTTAPYKPQKGLVSLYGFGSFGMGLTAEGDLSAESNVWGSAQSGDVLYSLDWEDLGFLPGPNPPIPRTALSLIEASDGALYAGDKYSCYVYRSTDWGQTWEIKGQLPNDCGWVWDLMEGSDGYLYAATAKQEADGARVAKILLTDMATPGAVTWTDTGPLPNNNGFAYKLLEVEYNDTTYILVGQYNLESFYRTVSRTDDGGITWVQTDTLPDTTQVRALMLGSDGNVYAGGGEVDAHVFRSGDVGTTWTDLGTVGTAEQIHDFVEGSDGCFYAATGNTVGAVYKSCDYGDTWAVTDALPGATHAYTITQQAGILYVGTGPNGDVFRSRDGGSNWELTNNLEYEYSSVLYNAGEVNQLLAASDGHVYAGTNPEEGAHLARMFRTGGLGEGQHDCPEGHYVIKVEMDPDGKVLGMECRPL